MGTGSNSAPDLVVDSATGVDVSLPIAGPGARALAFVVDWHIRVILLVTWYVVGAVIYNGRWNIGAPLEPDALWFIGVVIPPAAIFFLYHVVLEIAMRGRTPGKRMVGVRIVTRHGNVPTIGAFLTRNIFRLIDSFPLIYSVGLIATMLTRDHVRIGDIAAGTLLVYDRAHTPWLPGSRSSKLDANTAEVVSELLQRWDTLDPAARRRLARNLLDRYPPASTHERTPDSSSDRPDSPSAPVHTSTDGDAELRARLERLARGSAP
jgi:uncharacterized RDD family membrane protein YckC